MILGSSIILWPRGLNLILPEKRDRVLKHPVSFNLFLSGIFQGPLPPDFHHVIRLWGEGNMQTHLCTHIVVTHLEGSLES